MQKKKSIFFVQIRYFFEQFLKQKKKKTKKREQKRNRAHNKKGQETRFLKKKSNRKTSK